MCGRFALNLAHQEIQSIPGYDLQVAEWVDQDRFRPRYNIAPRSHAPVLRRRTHPTASTSGDSTDLVLHTMKWGLVPSWSKHEDKTLNTTNARSENLVDGGGMWSSIKGKKRCAVVCQGYFEWLSKGKQKLPHFTKHEDGRVMLMAGLYDCVILEGETEPLWTFTIVTTSANKEFSWLHDRQPVILSSKEALDTWLDTSEHTWTLGLTSLVQPYHDANAPLQCYQVPKEVGKVGTESATFIEPIANRKDGIQAMFSKQKQAQQSLERPKRRRSASPSAVLDIDTSTSSRASAKKPKLEKRTQSDDDEVETLGVPSTSLIKPDAPTSTKQLGSPSKTQADRKASPSKIAKKNVKPDKLSTKIIDDFFSKQ